jgi:hypothetical protein
MAIQRFSYNPISLGLVGLGFIYLVQDYTNILIGIDEFLEKIIVPIMQEAPFQGEWPPVPRCVFFSLVHILLKYLQCKVPPYLSMRITFGLYHFFNSPVRPGPIRLILRTQFKLFASEWSGYTFRRISEPSVYSSQTLSGVASLQVPFLSLPGKYGAAKKRSNGDRIKIR